MDTSARSSAEPPLGSARSARSMSPSLVGNENRNGSDTAASLGVAGSFMGACMATDATVPAVADSDRSTKGGKLPIKMLNDRILVSTEGPEGERKSTGGILIPATAQVGKRLTWAIVVAAGPNVRSMELDDRVLFNPEDRYEVEVGGHDYIILRERDVHAVAAERLDDSHTGLYL